MITEQLSKKIWVAKAFAIFCVCAAHTGGSYGKEAGLLLYYANRTVRWEGLLGVAAFFVLAGLFYRREKGDSKSFWKKKFQSVILPWLFCGTLVYLYEVLTNGYECSVGAYAFWMFGVETWLYFVPVLLECFVICKFADRLWKDLFLFGLSLFSYLATAAGLFSEISWYVPVMNPLNWLLFFEAGKLLREYVSLEKMDAWILKYRAVFLAFFAGMLIIWYIFDVECRNWSVYTLFFEFAGATVIYILASALWQSTLLVDIGKKSFTFYLLHTTFVGKMNTTLPEHFVIVFFKPVIALLMVYFIIKIASLICEKLHLDWCLKLVGVREGK